MAPVPLPPKPSKLSELCVKLSILNKCSIQALYNFRTFGIKRGHHKLLITPSPFLIDRAVFIPLSLHQFVKIMAAFKVYFFCVSSQMRSYPTTCPYCLKSTLDKRSFCLLLYFVFYTSMGGGCMGTLIL